MEVPLLREELKYSISIDKNPEPIALVERRIDEFDEPSQKAKLELTLVPESEYNPNLEREIIEDGVVIRPPTRAQNCCTRFFQTLSKFFCICGDSSKFVDEPPHRFMYLGRQKEFDHDLNKDGDKLRREPHIENEPPSEMCSNYVSTMKYNPFFFFPQNLYEQLCRPANFYFFIVAIISFSPYTAKGPLFSVFPFVVVIGISMIKEIIEDYNRFKMDKELNNKEVDVWDGRKFVKTIWQNLKVSDIVRITHKHNQIPADILLLQTSAGKGLANIETSNLDGETNLKQKQASLSTASLQYSQLDGGDYLHNLSIKVESEAPNEKMDSKGWKGSMTVNGGNRVPLGMTSMVLRGCSLRNTEWVIAMVIFTGNETKVMLNNKAVSTKISHLDAMMDWLLLRVFAVQILGMLVGAIGHAVWRDREESKYWYMYIKPDGFSDNGDNLVVVALETLLTFLTLLDVLVPISLYVTVEFSKMAQTFWINWDRNMRYLDEDQIEELEKGAKETPTMGIWSNCRTTSLNDEIGRINWIFSDKTGTLTRNVMEFLNCYVCGDTVSVVVECEVSCSTEEYEQIRKKRPVEIAFAKLLGEEDSDLLEKAIGAEMKADKYGQKFQKLTVMIPCLRGRNMAEEAEHIHSILQKTSEVSAAGLTIKVVKSRKVEHANGKKYGPGIASECEQEFSRIPTPSKSPAYSKKECRFEDNRLVWEAQIPGSPADQFLTALAVCHTVVPDDPPDKDDPLQFPYQASSPDDKALVVFAKNMHYFFKEVDVDEIVVGGRKIEGSKDTVRIYGKDVVFDVLDIIEFSSARKRQSTIVRDPRDGKIKVFCKGADNVILARLTEESKKKHWGKCEETLKNFAKIGLRTLCIAMRELTEEEFLAWWEKLENAKNDLDHKDELVPMVESEIEANLTLVGATAIEDRLQDGVPDTIASFHFARLNIWVLTGDKVETAINIGRSCRLITDKMQTSNNSLFVIDIDEKLEDSDARAETNKRLEEAQNYMSTVSPEDKPNQGLVLSGKALGFVFPIRKRDSMGREIPPTAEEAAREKELQMKVLEICGKCSAVLCCRVSPKQKAQMVELVKYNVDDAITLAVGDGANDVPMIKAAHVGVGIKGHEGIQAVMASDYSIGQFKYLQDLLFVHGAWNYRRLGKAVLYFLNKNVTMALTQLWFAFYSGFSGQMFYDSLAASSYNLIFTAAPVFLMAILDRPYSRELAKLCPEIYQTDAINLKLFYIYFYQGVVSSLVIFFVATCLTDSTKLSDGEVLGFAASYTVMFTCVLGVVTIKVMMETFRWFPLSLFAFIMSYLVWFGFEIGYSEADIDNLPVDAATAAEHFHMVGAPLKAFSSGRPWWIIIFVTVSLSLPEAVVRWYLRVYHGTKEDCVQEMEQHPDIYRDFLEKLQADRDAHNQKEYNPEITDFMGYTAFAPDRDADHAFGDVKTHKLARLRTQKTRRFAKSEVGILHIEDSDSEEASSVFNQGSFGRKSFAVSFMEGSNLLSPKAIKEETSKRRSPEKRRSFV